MRGTSLLCKAEEGDEGVSRVFVHVFGYSTVYPPSHMCVVCEVGALSGTA